MFVVFNTYDGFHRPTWRNFVDSHTDFVAKRFAKMSACCEYVNSGHRVDMHRF